MKKKYILPISIVVICAIAILAWRLPKKSAYTSMNTVNTQEQTSMSPEPTPSSAAKKTIPTAQPAGKPSVAPIKNGQYISYSSDVIAKTSGTKVLFFHAPWCSQCRALEASIQAGPIPSNVSIIKVDYDTNQALRQKYGVTIQTTLVRIDDSGNFVKKYNAYNSPTLESLRASVL